MTRRYWGMAERAGWVVLLTLAVALVLSPKTGLGGVGGPRKAEAAPVVTVRLVLEKILDLDSIDTIGKADFYAEATIDGQKFTAGPVDNTNPLENHPAFIFNKQVDLAVKSSIAIHLEIWDDDGGLNFKDNEIDINGNSGMRAVDLTVNLNPCGVTGNSPGATGLCGAALKVAGTEGDRAELTFRVEVDYPVVPNLRMRCTHTPAWPQPGQNVAFTVQALDGALNPAPVTKIELWINTQGTPTQTQNNASQLSASSSFGGGQFFYGCRVTSGANQVWSGWRTVQVGAPPASQGRAVPISYTGSSNGRLDFVFIPDSNSYPGGATDPNFLNHVASVIQGAYYARDVYLRNQDVINFWIAQDTGTVTLIPVPGAQPNCGNAAPTNWGSTYLFADAGVLLHVPNCRDNAPTNQRYFSSEPTSLNTIVHESGHTPFGLSDEYCCNTVYFQSNPNANVFSSRAACLQDPLAAGVADACSQIANASGSVPWWRLDSASTTADDLMADTGNRTYQGADMRRHDWLFGQCRTANC